MNWLFGAHSLAPPSYSGEGLGLASSGGDRLCSLSMGGLTLSEGGGEVGGAGGNWDWYVK